MKNPKADLESIMDLLAEWRKENGVGYVSMWITENGGGRAFDLDDGPSRYEVSKDYEEAESPGAVTPRESR
ncbi:hypothetical protein [Lacrimispora sp.]|uniref:hypothetical protein n=1 Tax=Lacrimispora sp. TaxID=2719234 RepID=UPI0028B127D9|nr:hypothetical protein [Lacrimispora sp.]